MVLSVLQELLRRDRELFNMVNSQWSNSFFDTVLPYVRNAIVWAPLYLFFIVFAIINFRRSGLLWVLGALLTVATSDLVSSWGIKELIFRLRPCRDEALAGHIRLLVQYCPKSSSFVSSHAVNHFAISMFIFLTLKDVTGKWLRLIFFWAFAICYAQVYVGVHYPVDVICGSMVGLFIGYCWGKMFNHSYSLQLPEQET
ncbi:MAG: phosphatase PAP2 family protein [Bacteroidetes bacterium]|nr:phosphatase PAP2 family protein [Bacteroidota bacterium]MBS1929805.1 phosphatase PAP2 family protein [Bacteroidota bacterium]